MNSNEDVTMYEDNFGQSGLYKAGAKKYLNKLKRGSMFSKNILNYLVDIHSSFTGNKVNMDKIELSLQMLESLIRDLERHYLFSLVFPEHPKAKNSRIPCKFPIPSFTFQQKTQFTVKPTSGNFQIQYIPQALFDDSTLTTVGSIWVCEDASLNGSTAVTVDKYTLNKSDYLLLQNAVQVYRLVSCTILANYIGSIDQHSGVLGGSVDISYLSTNTPDVQYSVFSNNDDKMFAVQTIPFNGMKLNYFPKDYVDLNFIRVNNATINLANQGIPTHIRLILYGQNLPKESSIRIEIIRNFEAVASSGFIDLTGSNTVVADSTRVENNDDRISDMALNMGGKMTEKNFVTMPITDIKEKENLVKDTILELPNNGDYKLKPFENDSNENSPNLFESSLKMGNPIMKSLAYDSVNY